MTRFIQQSACRGQRPAHLPALRHRSRPDHVARLLRDRRVPRILVAPTGFGKASLAAEYADIVFGFRHVFWVNGASPCFMRDLDEGVMGRAVLDADSEAALVVFADVRWLDERREAAFLAVVDELLEAGSEVIATTSPACGHLGAGRGDCARWSGCDLLVSDEEAAAAGDSRAARGPLALAERIPCLRWGDEGARTLALGCAREEMPADLRLVLWAMLVMGQGARADVRALLGADRGDEAWSYLAERYPFLGIDGDEETFEAVALDLGVLEEAFAGTFDAMARAAGCERRDELVCLLADRLALHGALERAAGLVMGLASRPGAAAWLGRRGWDLLWGGAETEVCALYEMVARVKVAERAAVNAMVAWAHGRLGHNRQALEFARKVTSATLAPPELKAAAALCAYRHGNGAVRERMAEVLAAWMASLPASALAPAPSSADGGAGADLGALPLLVEVALAERIGGDAVGRWARAWRGMGPGELPAGPLRQGLLLAAAWAVDAESTRGAFEPRREDAALLEGEDFACLVHAVGDGADDDLGTAGRLGWGALCAVEALDCLADALDRAGLPRPAEAVMAEARAMQLDRQRRRQAWEGRQRGRALGEALSSAALSAASEKRPSASAERRIAARPATPMLEVRLFGSVRVRIGEREVSAKLLSRRRARTLLALLVLHRGRELTREDLIAMLWPHADFRTGQKSFYRLWQDLRDILSADGGCPYLVRDRYGCRLEPSLFTSDVMEFETLVRRLLFDAASLSSWEEVYGRVRESFSGPLMPSEPSNETVIEFRERFSMELVDALVAASVRLRAAGESQGALWFARAALERDETREDAYAALMEAQFGAGQRGGAVATYHACRRFLADTLGLDPSRRLGTLYQRIIEEAPQLA